MPRSTRVRASDVMKCMEILGGCRDLGADADAWPVYLMEEARKLLGGQVVIAAEMRGFPDGPNTEGVGVYRVGWPSEEAEQRWCDYAGRVPLERTPEYPIVSRLGPRGVTLERDSIWGGPEVWERSKTFQTIHRECGIDDYIFSLRRLPNAGTVGSIWVHRAVGEKQFSPRERRLLSLLHDHLAEHVGTGLASGGEPRISSLSPRQKQVLLYLLEGLTEKEVAGELGLSKPTVHEHATMLYRAMGVSSRPELLARFIGRGKPLHLN